MSLESDLRQLLLTFTAVTDLVGTGGAARVRPYVLDEADDDSQPAVLIEVDADTPLNDLGGLGGLVYSDVNIKCRARTKATSRALAEAVRLNGTDPGTGLAGFSGTAGDSEIDAVLEDMTNSATSVADGSDEHYYDTDMSFVIGQAEVV